MTISETLQRYVDEYQMITKHPLYPRALERMHVLTTEEYVARRLADLRLADALNAAQSEEEEIRS